MNLSTLKTCAAQAEEIEKQASRLNELFKFEYGINLEISGPAPSAHIVELDRGEIENLRPVLLEILAAREEAAIRKIHEEMRQ